MATPHLDTFLAALQAYQQAHQAAAQRGRLVAERPRLLALMGGLDAGYAAFQEAWDRRQESLRHEPAEAVRVAALREMVAEVQTARAALAEARAGRLSLN